MKRRIFSICLVLGLLVLTLAFSMELGIANAQSVTPTPTPGCDTFIFTGHVYDAATGLGISGATVGVSLDVPRAYSTTTDATGAYSLMVPTGYTCHITSLSASAPGYNTLSKAASRVNPNDFSLTKLAALTPTRTSTPGGPTPTRTRTPTTGPSLTPSRTITLTFTPTTGPKLCTPTVTIMAPFVQDGVGTFCWQSTNLGTYINSWNLTSLTVNYTDYTNLYVAAGSLPAKINGNWYISYTSAASYGHFEAK
ncbi:MAG: carboxypeptidase regulatory-like domain-containing protein [Anaerolineales bacterium]